MLDATSFNEMDADKYKEQTRARWLKNPCDSHFSDNEMYSREYFADVERERYSLHPWIIENIQRLAVKGKHVLEIGLGMGTDHVN